MLKKESIKQVISKIVCVGLLLGMLPFSMPLYGQENKTKELEKLRLEVAKEVASIKKTVNRLQFARIAVPTILVGAGLTFTAIVATVVALLLLIPKLKLRKNWLEVLGKLKELEGESKKGIYYYKPAVEGQISSLITNLKDYFGKMGEKFLLDDVDFEKISSRATVINFQKTVSDLYNTYQKKIPTISLPATVISFIVVTIIGLVGTGIRSLGALFGLSAASVAAAFNGARKLEKLEAEHPGILTAEQKKLLEKLKKLSKNLLTQAIIKNLRLKDALTKVITTVVQQNTALVRALGKEKKARRIFGDYIKLKWQEELLTKGLAEGADFIKSAIVKLQLKKAKKKLANIESKNPKFKTVLAGVVQTYGKEANGILQELKEQIVKAAETGELKPNDLPVIPIPPIISL